MRKKLIEKIAKEPDSRLCRFISNASMPIAFGILSVLNYGIYRIALYLAERGIILPLDVEGKNILAVSETSGWIVISAMILVTIALAILILYGVFYPIEKKANENRLAKLKEKLERETDPKQRWILEERVVELTKKLEK